MYPPFGKSLTIPSSHHISLALVSAPLCFPGNILPLHCLRRLLPPSPPITLIEHTLAIPPIPPPQCQRRCGLPHNLPNPLRSLSPTFCKHPPPAQCTSIRPAILSQSHTTSFGNATVSQKDTVSFPSLPSSPTHPSPFFVTSHPFSTPFHLFLPPPSLSPTHQPNPPLPATPSSHPHPPSAPAAPDPPPYSRTAAPVHPTRALGPVGKDARWRGRCRRRRWWWGAARNREG